MNITKQDFIDNEIRNICYSITPVSSGSSVGYTLRKTGELLGDIYKIFVNSELKPDVMQFVLDHEFGHVIFGHMNNDALNEALAISKMETSYDNYKHLFPDDVTKDDAVNFAKGALLNIAMDCEVNSKLFTKDEYDHFEKEICGDKETHLIHPTNYDLPVEESYIYYINGLCDNPEKMIEDFFKEKDNQQNQSSQQNNQGQQGHGQQSQSSSGNSQSQNQNGQNSNQSQNGNGQTQNNSGNSNQSNQSNSGNKQISSGNSNGNEQKSSFDKNGKISKEAFEKAKKEIQESTAGTMMDGTMMDNDNTSKEYDGPGQGNENREVQVEEKDQLEEVKRTVLKEIIQTVRTSKKDMMYNYNRRKNGSNVIVSKQISSIKKEIGKAYFIVDVSGSMSQVTLEKLYNTFTEIGKQINRESRIILWNEELVSDKKIFEKELRVGGGTKIADAIDYVSEKYLTRKDILFVCSDFEDNIANWNIALEKAKYRKSYGILLGKSSSKKAKFDKVFKIDNI